MSSFEEGRQARREGKPRNANPYPSGPMRSLWDEGWVASDTIIRALGQG